MYDACHEVDVLCDPHPAPNEVDDRGRLCRCPQTGRQVLPAYDYRDQKGTTIKGVLLRSEAEPATTPLVEQARGNVVFESAMALVFAPPVRDEDQTVDSAL